MPSIPRAAAASLLGLLALCVTSAPALPGRAARPLETGALLVARRGLPDPNFSETVVLVLGYGPGGAVGLVVNRPSDVELGALAPRIEGLDGRSDRLYIGGPVQGEDLFVLVRAEEPPVGTEPVFEGVYVGHDEEVLKRLGSADLPPARLRVYAGYAGWAPGQLENEIERGDWYTVPPDEESIFTSRPKETWQRLVPPIPTERAEFRYTSYCGSTQDSASAASHQARTCAWSSTRADHDASGSSSVTAYVRKRTTTGA